MGATKTDQFTDMENNFAVIAKAIGHPARIAILNYLQQIDSCICSDIVNVLPLAQPTVSQHLKELKNANLISGSIDGNSICYCINKKTFEKVMVYFSKFAKKSKIKNCC